MNKLLILLLIIVVILAISMNTKVEGLRNYWLTEENKDYSGNTIRSFTNVNEQSCRNSCISDSRCAGIVRDVNIFDKKGTCWLKSNFDNGVDKNGRYTHRLTRV